MCTGDVHDLELAAYNTTTRWEGVEAWTVHQEIDNNNNNNNSSNNINNNNKQNVFTSQPVSTQTVVLPCLAFPW